MSFTMARAFLFYLLTIANSISVAVSRNNSTDAPCDGSFYSKGYRITYEEWRLFLLDFYNSSGEKIPDHPALGKLLADPLHKACPAATLASLLMAQERELLLLHYDTSQTKLKLAQINHWHQDYVRYTTLLSANGTSTFPGWPLDKIIAGVKYYHDLLWRNVRRSEDVALDALYNNLDKNPESFVSDDEYFQALNQVNVILRSLQISWTPIDGTLLALARFGHRSLPTEPSDPRRHRHLFENDIDIMMHFPNSKATTEGIYKVSDTFNNNGWNCWGHSSLSHNSKLHHLMDIRPIDISYCIMSYPGGKKLVLDIVAVAIDHVDGENGQPMAYVFKTCVDEVCTIPSDVGALKANGGVVSWNAIRPTRLCLGFTIDVPCPEDFDLTLRAKLIPMGPGKQNDCLAYPLDDKLEQWDEVDLEMAHVEAQKLDEKGYVSVKSMFQHEACLRKKTEIMARIAKRSALGRNGSEKKQARQNHDVLVENL